jgi:hypothetical protein
MMSTRTLVKTGKWSGIIMAAAAVIAVVVLVVLNLPKPLLPKIVTRQVSFSIFAPDKKVAQIDSSTVKYDASQKLLSYYVNYAGTRAVVSEQPTPEQFIDIPQTYEKVRESMREYSKFDTPSGIVYLTMPDDLKGRQAAVLNSKGTLVFIKPDRNLQPDEWRRLGNSLSIL